jgi:hypothetical protein
VEAGGSEGGDGHVSAPSPSGVMTVVNPTVTSTEGSNRRVPGNAGEGHHGFNLRRDEHRIRREASLFGSKDVMVSHHRESARVGLLAGCAALGRGLW